MKTLVGGVMKLALNYFGTDCFKNGGIYYNGTQLYDYNTKDELETDNEKCLEFIKEVQLYLMKNKIGNLNGNVICDDLGKVCYSFIPMLNTFFIYLEQTHNLKKEPCLDI